MREWSPTDFVLKGEFATGADLIASTDELQRVSGRPVVVAVFSGRWLFSSLSLARSDDNEWNSEIIEWLRSELFENLADANDKFAYVAGLVSHALSQAGCTEPRTLSFGSNLERPGKVAAIIGGQGLEAPSATNRAEKIAACVFASRPAAFSLDTSLELALLSELRQSAERSRPTLSSLANPASNNSIGSLLKFASSVLGTSAVVAYEADHDNPHRFAHLDRRSCVLSSPGDLPGWIPLRVALTENLDIPAPPELSGSRFESLRELVDHCVASKGRPRRLVAQIAGEYWAYGVPYGFDDLRRRAIGVLCLVWQSDNDRRLGPYEISASRMIALHLARGYDMRHASDAVRLVTGQLSFISDLPSPSQNGGLIGCDEILRARRDVGLIAPSVVKILRGLVNLSGAMSVTCRLITGADGPCLSRHLVRLHCEGDDCAIASPNRIPLDNAGKSVNAWVAKTGESVYLRTLRPGPEPYSYTSADLESYEGLDEVSVFRDGVKCELCVPIFAERRLVGTVNLEADRSYAFDAMAETVAEYAQLIGIALLESRRRIGVETVTEIEGFLDYRHRLEAGLRDLAKDIKRAEALTDDMRTELKGDIDELLEVVFMRRVPDALELKKEVRIRDAVESAMTSVEWATRKLPMADLSVEPWSDLSEAVYQTRISKDAARALTFAVAQALHNVRDHGGSGDALADRKYSAMFRFAEMQLGGKRGVYISISSTAKPEMFERLDPQRVFREPIDNAKRISLGTFLAGEALRRCGGSAYMRVESSPDHDSIVDAEFGVPGI